MKAKEGDNGFPVEFSVDPTGFLTNFIIFACSRYDIAYFKQWLFLVA
jgi:hypothetical protein